METNRNSTSEEMTSTSMRFLQATREVVKNHAVLFNGIIVTVFVLAYHFYEMYVEDAVGDTMPRYLVGFACLLTIVLFGCAFAILHLTLHEMRSSIDREVEDKVAEKLECQHCVTEMFEIQKRLYNVELENFVQTLSVEDIRKINLLINSLTEDDIVSEDEIAKVQTFISILLRIKERGKVASYITMDDMQEIEGTVGNSSTIHIISSSISCDNQLKSTIINNLKRGIRYNYYFPRNKDIKITRDAKFKELIRQFNENMQLWRSDSGVTDDMILQQVNCHWFPEEYMQMSLNFYDYQKLAQGGKPTIVVKFPAMNDDVIRDYPLFFFIDSECSMNDSFCKVFSAISNHSLECNVKKNAENGKIEVTFDSNSRRNRAR